MITLKLGDFTFTRLEIPSHIPMGGEHKLVIHELVGGTRIVDAMGKSYDPLKWSGFFLGSDALQKAKYFDYLRKQGKVLPLSWATLKYNVIIQQFQFDFEQQFKIPYSMTCVVVTDESDQVTSAVVVDIGAVVVDIDQALKADIGTAAAEADALEETTEVPATGIKASIAKIKAAIDKVRKFVKATQDQIKEIKDTIQDAQRQVTQAIASVNNTVQNISTLGGILPNNPVSVNAAKLGHNVSSVNNAVQLNQLQYTLKKMNKNVDSNNPRIAVVGIATITVMGGTLFELAAKYYGDATKWDTIATANKLTSPYITSEVTLVIPKKPVQGA
jgi:hypothetical protein